MPPYRPQGGRENHAKSIPPESCFGGLRKNSRLHVSDIGKKNLNYDPNNNQQNASVYHVI
jgi:hypothetical protein